MATQIEVDEAKGRLDELLARAKAGEEIVLAEQGKPVVKLTSAADVGATDLDAEAAARGYGMYKGKIWMSDDFNAPLPEDELREWEK